MHKVLKWGLGALGGLFVLVMLVMVTAFAWSQLIIGERYEVSGRDVPIPAGDDALERGRRVVLTRGCLGCHGRDGAGQVMVDDPMLAVVAAPNLTRLVHERSIESLDRSIRGAVRDDGTSVVIMPSAMLSNLSDEDFGAMIAYLRSLPRVEGEVTPERHFGPIARAAFVLGHFETERQKHEAMPRLTPAPGDLLRHGRYLAFTSCTECHGVDLHGSEEGAAMGIRPPDLRIVAAYSLENFIRLMREGVPQGDESRDLGLMKEVSQGRFAFFTDTEIAALHAYLSSPEFLASEGEGKD